MTLYAMSVNGDILEFPAATYVSRDDNWVKLKTRQYGGVVATLSRNNIVGVFEDSFEVHGSNTN